MWAFFVFLTIRSALARYHFYWVPFKMECPNCHIENPEDNKFCRECGTVLLPVCDGCGTTLQPGDNFCGKCGHDLRKLKKAPPIDYSEPQSYTPRFLADKILTTRSAIEGERKLVTVGGHNLGTALYDSSDSKKQLQTFQRLR